MVSQLSTAYDPYAAILRFVKRSIYAEQVFCSIVTQMKFLPQFESQAALNTVHEENYETSYHRNTAAGNLRRLVAHGMSDELLVLMTVECFVETQEHDKKAEAALYAITASDMEGRNLLFAAKEWHKRRRVQLKHAIRTLRSTIGPELWQKGVALAE